MGLLEVPPRGGSDNQPFTLLGRPPEVLYVEDHDDNRIALSAYFRMNGLVVHEAADGAEAIELMRTLRPDVVLLDLALPRVDGWEVARWIRAQHGVRLLPILLFTAMFLSVDRAFAQSQGVDDFLAKPTMPSVLLRTLLRCLETGWSRGYRADGKGDERAAASGGAGGAGWHDDGRRLRNEEEG